MSHIWQFSFNVSTAMTLCPPENFIFGNLAIFGESWQIAELSNFPVIKGILQAMALNCYWQKPTKIPIVPCTYYIVVAMLWSRGGPTCVHESLQVQCIGLDVITWPQWHQCTELVVIRARMSDLLWLRSIACKGMENHCKSTVAPCTYLKSGCGYNSEYLLDSLARPSSRDWDWSTAYPRVVLITEIGNDQSQCRSNVMWHISPTHTFTG